MTRPNLLVIMSDEHQARALGCAGHPFVQTPNLDRLARRGMRFSNAYTPSPICVPARAAFATGKYVHQTRYWDNAMPYDGEVPGWGHALQAQDFAVESIGKLHYRFDDDDAGFDVEQIPIQVVGAWHGLGLDPGRGCARPATGSHVGQENRRRNKRLHGIRYLGRAKDDRMVPVATRGTLVPLCWLGGAAFPADLPAGIL